MKILVTSSVDPIKSAHSRLHEFLKYLSEKHEITILSINDWWKSKQVNINPNNDLTKILQKVNLLYLTEKRISPIFQELFSIKSVNKLDKEGFDIHFNYASFICGYVVAKRLKVPTIYDIADNWTEMVRDSPQIPSIFRPVGALLVNKVVQKNIKISAKVTYSSESLRSLYRFPDEKSILIPNGVDTELFRKVDSDLKRTLGLEDCFVLGYVGVLREWVDLEPAFMALKDLDEEVKMVVVGKEGRFDENVRLAKKWGVSNRVTFTGMVPYSQVPKYISATDVCLISFKANAISEHALPLKLFEYMACEKPVISTELLGVKAVAGNKVMYASNKKEYKEKIMELYKNEELRREMGKTGREFVEEKYNWDKDVKRR